MTIPPSGTEPHATVVVADDEVHIVDVLALLLEPFGVTVVKAYNGEQALRAVREHSPQLVIADVMMPKLSGIEVCRQIKADALTARIPVILLSSLLDAAVKRSGADAFVSKPFDIDEVEAYARRYLGAASSQQTDESSDGDSSAITR